MEQKKIDRINELARKAKTTGLTDEETEERAVLRREYIEAFRANTRATLESIVIQEEDGSLTPLQKKTPEKIAADKEHHHHHHHDENCSCGCRHNHVHEHDYDNGVLQ